MQNRFDVSGRIACVTGASSGIGRALATALVEAGARTVGVARRSEALEEWRGECSGETASVTGDVGDLESIPDLASAVAGAFGPPDILISAAGVNPRKDADTVGLADWQQTLDINLSAPFLLAREFVVAMREKGWGRIVNIASLQTERAFPAGIAYGASKGGIGQLTRAMAEAWSRDGINANAIAPGFFPTELSAPVFADPDRAEANAAQTCIGRNGELEDLIGPCPVPVLAGVRLRYRAGAVCRRGIHRQVRALVYEGVRELSLRELEEPAAGDGVVVNVEAVGICGSDMHAWKGHDGRRPAPLILGHEASGIVEGGRFAGKRVTINPLVTCMACEDCHSGRTNLCASRQIISMAPRPGAFAERVAIPERNLIEVPDHVTPQQAAISEPITCSWHAIRLAGQRLSRPLAETRAVVLGGGAIGLGAALVLKHHGCRDIWIAETNAVRHRLLQDAGPFRVYDPLGGDGPPPAGAMLVVDAFGGDATRKAACQLVQPGGVIAHIGLAGGEAGLDIRRMTLEEITFIGTYTYTQRDFQDTAEAIFAGGLGELDWCEERALEDGASAFADIDAGTVAAPKILLRP